MLNEEQIEFVVANIKNDSVRELVIEEFMPCIAAAARRAIRNGYVSYEDFVQEGRLGIITALDRFDGDKTTFVSYIAKYIRGFISHATYKRRNTENSMTTSIDDVVSESDENENKIGDYIKDESPSIEDRLDKFDNFKLVIKATDKLTDLEKAVLVLYYLEELTLKEISEKIFYTIPGVKAIRDRAINKIRKVLNVKKQELIYAE